MDELPESANVIDKLHEEYAELDKECDCYKLIMKTIKKNILKELTNKYIEDDPERFKNLNYIYENFHVGIIDIDQDSYDYKYNKKYYDDLDYLLYDCNMSIEVIGNDTLYQYTIKENKKPKIIEGLNPDYYIEFNYGIDYHRMTENY